MIAVTIARPDTRLDTHWGELAPYSHNVFMNPAALRAASETMIAVVYVLLAWEISSEPARLVGMWALQAKQFLFWHYLEALPFNYAFLSTPVLNPAYASEIMPAFFAAIARERGLPDTLVLSEIDAEGPEYSAMRHALARHPVSLIRADQRPVATREAGIKRTGATRKKLRQDWNRLASTGTAQVVNVTEPAEVAAAFEQFLEMERRSWKGEGGTAILSSKRDTVFARRLIGDLAARGEASVALLQLDGRPIAAQVLIYQGRHAFTWKTSFDPDHARFSPGVLLVDRIITQLLDSGAVDTVDSCARGDSFMGQLLSARKPMVDLVASAVPRTSPAYRAVSGYLRAREELKHLRDRLPHHATAAGPARAVTPPAAAPADAAPARSATAGPASTTDRAA